MGNEESEQSHFLNFLLKHIKSMMKSKELTGEYEVPDGTWFDSFDEWYDHNIIWAYKRLPDASTYPYDKIHFPVNILDFDKDIPPDVLPFHEITFTKRRNSKGQLYWEKE